MDRRFVILSHLRWIAAALVALNHFRGLLMQDYEPGAGLIAGAFYFATGFGHSSVIVFFVLSGFLVGRKVRAMAREETPDIWRYFVDRFSRIFIVAWPAMALSLLILLAVVTYAPSAPVIGGNWSRPLWRPLGPDVSPTLWASTFGLLNEIVTRTPAVNGPLWSLACEWTYYMVAGAGVALLRRRWSWIIPYAALLAVGVMVRDRSDPTIAWNVTMLLVGGAVWTLGLLASVASDRGVVRGRVALTTLCAMAAATFLSTRFTAVPDLVLGAAIAAMISHSRWRIWSFAPRLGEQLAGFSYTLYAVHFPFAVALVTALALRHRLPAGPSSIALTVGAFLVAGFLARGLAMVTEDQTARVRRAVSGAFRPNVAIEAS